MTKIKFGTDGWRAIIAKDYTLDNVKRVAEATALWLKERNRTSVVIGYDCRFGGQMFAEGTASVIAAHGIKCFLSPGFVSTPMVGLGVVKKQAGAGIVITASHNPPSYNGFKLKSNVGGPMVPKEIAEVEALIPTTCSVEGMSLTEAEAKGLLEYVDLETIYIEEVEAKFDLDMIKQSGIKIAYDAMYGAGQNAMKRLFPEAELMHCEYNPSFHGQAPEPIHRNLIPFSNMIKQKGDIGLGIANDGDADRIGLYDGDGNFVDSHHVLLLLLQYMREHKKMDGKVAVSFSVTDKMKTLTDQLGLELDVTKIGFKYIAEIMAEETVLVGGEESGGLAVAGHIPERDGIWTGIVMLEFMAKTGKSLKELVQDLYQKVGSFTYDRDDLHLTEEKKQAIVAACKAQAFDKIGDDKITQVDDLDGMRFYLEGDKWLMVRPSGTEPVLRVYAQAPTMPQTRATLDAFKVMFDIK